MNTNDLLAQSYQTQTLTLREVLEEPNFAGTAVLAGSAGLDRLVSSVNVMENPDIIPWVKQNELLITVGYSLQRRGKDMAGLIADLDDRKLAGFGVKLGPYVTKIDKRTLATADKRGFPILALPAAVSFDDLIADVYSARDSLLLGGLHRKSDRERELMNVALGGGGTVQVAKRLAELVDCEVLVLGIGNEVVAHSGGSAEPDLSDSERFENAIGAPIVFGSTYVGQLYIFPADGRSTSFFPGLVPTCAQIMALAASREIAVASVDRQFRAEFVEQVLLNRLSDGEVDRRCQALEWNVSYPAVVIDLAPATLDATAHLERVRDMLAWALRAEGLHAPHAIINGNVVAIAGVAGAAPNESEAVALAALQEVLSRCAPDTWSAGVSSPTESSVGLPKAWDQAQVATKVTRTMKGAGATGRFADLGVHRLLSEVDVGLLQSFAREALGDLHEPTGSLAELRRTLKVLLETNMNVAQAAREMHYHYNSVRYRTVQLEKMLGPFVASSTRRLELHVALLICDMLAEGDRTDASDLV
ncbi:MAG: PucR family transcriptional regulator [bacterium]|nr:PucR family transcriptional regulator [bacterium]MCP4967346.1 PucR family transcriptional regulator [bacterium]